MRPVGARSDNSIVGRDLGYRSRPRPSGAILTASRHDIHTQQLALSATRIQSYHAASTTA